jgi:hypothetical protein
LTVPGSKRKVHLRLLLLRPTGCCSR